MKPEIKAKWIAALKSGQYKQAQQKLTDGKGFCCLGVLCNLHALETDGHWERNPFGQIRYSGEAASLPVVVRVWAGIESCNPHAGGTSLAQHNDGDKDIGVRRKGFNGIAKLIAKHL